MDIGIGETFTGHNTEIYDCVICCNPLKLAYEVYEGEISSLTLDPGFQIVIQIGRLFGAPDFFMEGIENGIDGFH